jgi:transcriptional regulator with XRE-family HTH domain
LASSAVFEVSLCRHIVCPELSRSSLRMASLSNYLLTHRKRLTLSQEEVAFLLGVKGMDRGIKVSRDENFAREPSLQTALAYEAIYGRPVRELFAGLYEQVEQEVAKRAKLLSHRVTLKPRPKRQEVITNLVSKIIK